jgi:hypothetical protein
VCRIYKEGWIQHNTVAQEPQNCRRRGWMLKNPTRAPAKRGAQQESERSADPFAHAGGCDTSDCWNQEQ